LFLRILFDGGESVQSQIRAEHQDPEIGSRLAPVPVRGRTGLGRGICLGPHNAIEFNG